MHKALYINIVLSEIALQNYSITVLRQLAACIFSHTVNPADQLTNRPYEILEISTVSQGVIVDDMKACTMKTISLVEHLHLVNV